MRPFLLCWNQTGAIGIEEYIQTIGLDFFLYTQPVFKEIALPIESPSSQQIFGLRFQSRNHPT